MQFDPDLFRLLTLLHRFAQGLGPVHAWRAADHPPYEGATAHAVPTLVVCLEGAVRVTAAAGRTDLGAGEALLLGPGAWHDHAPLRRGAAAYLQGFVAGRSDIFLDTYDRHQAGMVRRQPSRALLQRALDADQAEARRRLVAENLQAVLAQPMDQFGAMGEPLERMAAALWYSARADMTVAEAVRRSGLGHSQAHAVFRRWFGTSPKRLLGEQRLAWAVEALREGRTVGEAAARAGFPSRVAFTRAFAARFGLPPRRWREADLADAW